MNHIYLEHNDSNKPELLIGDFFQMFKTPLIVLSTAISLTFATSILAEGHTGCCHQGTKAHQTDHAPKVSHGHGKSLHQQWCVRCHGSIQGEGLLGPNLTKSVETLSKEEFVHIVTQGKKGSAGRMPGWKSNPRVMKGMDKLYAFLIANSSKAE